MRRRIKLYLNAFLSAKALFEWSPLVLASFVPQFNACALISRGGYAGTGVAKSVAKTAYSFTHFLGGVAEATPGLGKPGLQSKCLELLMVFAQQVLEERLVVDVYPNRHFQTTAVGAIPGVAGVSSVPDAALDPALCAAMH